MKRNLLAALLAVIITVLAVTPAYAAKITGAESDGNKITAQIMTGSGTGIDKDKVTATLDGKPLSVESIDAGDGSTEYIVMIDTSLSLSKAHFDAQKDAVRSLYESLGKNDRFILYTFDKTCNKILNGSENKEEALKQIAAVKAAGQDTAFYDAVVTMTEEISESESANIVPVLFTDGIETLDKGAKGQAEKALKNSGAPVYAMYPSVEKEKDSAALNDLMKLSGGGANAYKPDDVTGKLKVLADEKATGAYTAVLTCGEAIAENDKAVLSIDIGDGSPATFETPVKEWQPSETETQAQTQPEESKPAETETTAQPAEEPGLDIMKIVIPAAAALVLLLAVLLIFKKLKGGKPKGEKPEKPEKPKKEKKEKKDKKKKTEAEPETPEPAPVTAEEPDEQPEAEPETPAEAPEPEPEADTEPEQSETGPVAEDGDAAAEAAEEEPVDPEADAEAKEAARIRAEERAKRRAANLERAKAAAAARAAMVSQMGSETKEAAEAAAAKEAEDAKKREKEAAQAAKERAKKEKANRKKMKEEGGNFQFYFVDKDKK